MALGLERRSVPGRAGDVPAGGGTDGGAGRQARPTAAAGGRTPAPAPPPRRRRRLATTLVFTALFFSGASFSAIAGDEAIQLLEEQPAEVAALEEAALEEAAVDDPVEAETVAEAPVPETVAPEPAAPPASEPVTEAAPAPVDLTEAVTVDPVAVVSPAPAVQPAAAPAPARPAAKAPATRTVNALVPRPKPAPVDPEVTGATASTVWLNRPLADPTPPSLRLSRAVAKRLAAEGRRHNVDWALVLGVLRADGVRRPLPARSTSIAETAALLAETGVPRNPTVRLLARADTMSATERAEALEQYYRQAWSAALAVSGRTTKADRAVALAKYYRAVGLRSLVRGLEAEQERLAKRLLDDPRVYLYPGGRADVEAGRIDVRVLALIAYLAESYGQVTVSSLFSGHRLYSRPGVVSAHIYGQAVDIAALAGVPIVGHQDPGSVTERAVRDILLLPAEVLPRQVISLLGLGGPSFPLADHDDHIHVGY